MLAKHIEYARWTGDQQKTYWFGVIKYAISNPGQTISWKCWKPQGFFRKLQKEFGGTKTSKQIKSFDNRMKIQFEKRKTKVSMIQAIPIALQQFQLTDEQNSLLQNFVDKIQNSSQPFQSQQNILNNIQIQIKQNQEHKILLESILKDCSCLKSKEDEKQKEQIIQKTNQNAGKNKQLEQKKNENQDAKN